MLDDIFRQKNIYIYKNVRNRVRHAQFSIRDRTIPTKNARYYFKKQQNYDYINETQSALEQILLITVLTCFFTRFIIHRELCVTIFTGRSKSVPCCTLLHNA